MSNSLSVDDLNTEFLPLVYEIIRSYDSHEMSGLGQKAQQSQQSVIDCNSRMQSLRDKFNQFREQVNQIKGIGVTQEEQTKSLDALRQQLILKRELLLKYKNSCPFDPNHKI